MFYRSGEMKGLNVLVVDESPAVTSLLTDVFTGHGATVKVANTAFEAMRRMLTERFDLITVEIIGSGQDRMKVLEFIRNCRKDLASKTLVITAYRYDRQMVASLASMRIPYLFKPFDMEDLFGLCRRMQTVQDPTAAA